jgi:nucleotidyltransferase substrate binding protein (TIGR01987 family)
MSLNLSPFQNAVNRLEEGLVRFRLDEQDDQVRDGLIQRFEFTYELAHKTLKRFLESASPDPASLDQATFQELIRLGNEMGLLRGDWSLWKGYREMRSRSSHTYDANIALEIVQAIPEFIEECRYLLVQLNGRQP